MGGSALLAVSAYLSGALASGDPGAGFRTGWFAAVSGRFTIGLVCWLAGAIVLVIAWWHSPASSVRDTLITGAMWAAPLLVAPPLGSRDVYAYGCQGWIWWHGGNPYTTGVLDGGCPSAASVPDLWWHTATPYGPLAVVLSGLASAAPLVIFRLLALGAAALLAWQLPRLGSPIALRLGLVTPLVLIHGISGLHNDLLVAALVVWSLTLAIGHRAAVWVGLVLAAAVGIKATALVAVPFALILLGRRWWVGALSAAGGFAVLSAVTGLGLGWIPALRHTGELAQWSSPPTAVGMAVGYVVGHASTAIAVTRAIGLAALAGFAAWQLYRAWRGRHDPRRVIVACGQTLAAAALLGPVFYPWYAIVPLAVLSATSRRWLAPAVVVCTFLVLPNGLGVPVLTKAVGAFAVTAAVIVLVIKTRGPARVA